MWQFHAIRFRVNKIGQKGRFQHNLALSHNDISILNRTFTANSPKNLKIYARWAHPQLVDQLNAKESTMQCTKKRYAFFRAFSFSFAVFISWIFPSLSFLWAALTNRLVIRLSAKRLHNVSIYVRVFSPNSNAHITQPRDMAIRTFSVKVFLVCECSSPTGLNQHFCFQSHLNEFSW